LYLIGSSGAANTATNGVFDAIRIA
jgi:hypothetical protein